MATQTSTETTSGFAFSTGNANYYLNPSVWSNDLSLTTGSIGSLYGVVNEIIGHTHSYTDVIQVGYQPSSVGGTTGGPSGFASLGPETIVAGQPLDSHTFNAMVTALAGGVTHSHSYVDSGNGTFTTSTVTNPIPLPNLVAAGSPVLESDRAQLINHIAWYQGHTHTYSDTAIIGVAPQPLHFITGTANDPLSTPATLSCDGSYPNSYIILNDSTSNNILPQVSYCGANVAGYSAAFVTSQIYLSSNVTGGSLFYTATGTMTVDSRFLWICGYPSNYTPSSEQQLGIQVNGPPGHQVYVLVPGTDLYDGGIMVDAPLLYQGSTYGSGICTYEDQGALYICHMTLDSQGNGTIHLSSTVYYGKFMIGIVDATATGVSVSYAVDRCFDINNYLANAVPWVPFNCTNYESYGSASCFPAGSQVLMPDLSTKNIEDIAEGELVMGANGQPVAVEIMDRVILGYNRNGTPRKLFTLLDGSLMWSEEHLFWTVDQSGEEWWWGADPDQWRHEVFTDHVVGLFDNYSVRQGSGFRIAHMSGWKEIEYEEVPGMVPELPLYLPRCDGTPIIVNGYVVTAGTNQFRFDYSQFRWDPSKIKALQDE